MENSVEEALARLIERATSGINEVVEFSQAQLPDVIEQLLMWNMTESLITFFVPLFFMLLFFTILFCQVKNLLKDMNNNNNNDWFSNDGLPNTHFLCMIGLPACGVIVSFLVMIKISTMVWLQIMIAPKLYLLEYASNLVR